MYLSKDNISNCYHDVVESAVGTTMCIKYFFLQMNPLLYIFKPLG